MHQKKELGAVEGAVVATRLDVNPITQIKVYIANNSNRSERWINKIKMLSVPSAIVSASMTLTGSDEPKLCTS